MFLHAAEGRVDHCDPVVRRTLRPVPFPTSRLFTPWCLHALAQMLCVRISACSSITVIKDIHGMPRVEAASQKLNMGCNHLGDNYSDYICYCFSSICLLNYYARNIKSFHFFPPRRGDRGRLRSRNTANRYRRTGE